MLQCRSSKQNKKRRKGTRAASATWILIGLVFVFHCRLARVMICINEKVKVFSSQRLCYDETYFVDKQLFRKMYSRDGI